MCVFFLFVCLLKLFKDVAYKSTVKERERERERETFWGGERVKQAEEKTGMKEGEERRRGP